MKSKQNQISIIDRKAIDPLLKATFVINECTNFCTLHKYYKQILERKSFEIIKKKKKNVYHKF